MDRSESKLQGHPSQRPLTLLWVFTSSSHREYQRKLPSHFWKRREVQQIALFFLATSAFGRNQFPEPNLPGF